MAEQLKYGLLDGNLVHIRDVPSGLDCRCVCPHCKSTLVAKKGEKNTYHFAHYRSAECNHGGETALHLLAKKVLLETKTLYVPGVPISVYDMNVIGSIVTFDNAEVEKAINAEIRSDVLLWLGDRFLNVEFKVKHPVDMGKKIALFNAGIPTIEIDLSEMGEDFDEASIASIVSSGAKTQLVFTPKAKAVYVKLWLGEWKKVYDRYVKDCPITRQKAYFTDTMRRGGSSECHECDGYNEYIIRNNLDEMMLCLGIIDGMNFENIDKILNVQKIEQHLQYAEFLMKDGSIVFRGRKGGQKNANN